MTIGTGNLGRAGEEQLAEPLGAKRSALPAVRLAGHRLAIGLVLLLAALLTLPGLNRLGYANSYYSAGVRSMLQSWHNAFFVSFDPGGFVSIDKPPLGFMIQTLSAKILGFSGFSVLLPEALATIASAGLLYLLGKRVFGAAAGVLAALAFVVTPVVIAVARNNTIDALLVVVLLCAALAMTKAVETDKLGWLLGSMALVGAGFEIKMLQAYLVLPALVLMYALGSRRSWKAKIGRLALGGVVVLAVSLAWAVAVDLTPAAARPFVGSSENNSALNLALGYNGLHRLLPGNWALLGGADAQAIGPGGAGMGPGGYSENGDPGLFRLFASELAGQIAWLLPLALLGLAAAWWQEKARFPLGLRHATLAMWGTWLATAAAFFSIGNMFHRYYLVMLAPPIAALVGAGLVAMWADYRRPGWKGWLLPAGIAGTSLLAAYILRDYPDERRWLTPLVLALGAGATIALTALRHGPAPRGAASAFPTGVVALSLAAILLVPATWAGITTARGLQGNGDGGMPVAGPATAFGGFGGPGRGGPGGFGDDAASAASDGAAAEGATAPQATDAAADDGRPGGMRGFGGEQVDKKLLAYLEANRGSAKYLFTTESAMSASAYILATGEPVAALGGFAGGDKILTNEQLAAKVKSGEMRFFLVRDSDQQPAAADAAGTDAGTGAASGDDASANRGGFGPPGRPSANTSWVQENCTLVPASEWQTPSASADTGGPFGANALYDCKNAG